MSAILFQLRRWWEETKAFLAGGKQPPVTVDYLLLQLDSWWPWRAARAARALRSFRDPDIVPALARALRRSWWNVKRAAIDSLAEIGGKEAWEAVAEVLSWKGSWPWGQLRRHAAMALGRRGREESLLPLCAALEKDPDASVRGAAAAALGQLWMRGVVNPLLSARHDIQELSQRFAARPDLATAPGMGRLLEVMPQALQELRESPDYAAEREVLDRVGRALCQVVEKDWQTSAAESAIRALSHLGDARAIACLVRALQRHSPEPNRRQTISAALRRVVQHLALAPDPADLQPLLQAVAVSDRIVQEAASEGLCNLATEFLQWPSEEATTPLIQLLKAPRPEVRLRAIQSLGEVGDARALAALQAETHLFSNLSTPELKAAALEAIAAIEARSGSFTNRELSRVAPNAEPLPTDRSLTPVSPLTEEDVSERLTEPVGNAAGEAEVITKA